MKNIEDNPDKEDFQNRLEELLKKLEIKKEELENLEKEKDSPIDNKNPKDSD
jgi:hypothetical protein